MGRIRKFTQEAYDALQSGVSDDGEILDLLIGDLKRDIWLKTLIFISVRIWDGLGLMMASI